MRILLIHDTRSVSLLSSVVLHRVLSRSGHSVTAFFGTKTTRHAKDFWPNAAKLLPLDGIDQVYLCCITFDDTNPLGCTDVLNEIQRRAPSGLVILTHRWPDGYANCGIDVVIPPFDLIEAYAKIITPGEREILRYSLIISRQAEPEFVSDDDFTFCEYLGSTIWSDVEGFWQKLTEDLEQTLIALREAYVKQGRLAYRNTNDLGEITGRGAGWIQFRLAKQAYGHCEKTLEKLMRSYEVPADFLGIGILESPDLEVPRLYIYRPWTSRLLPSISWLLEEHSKTFDLPSPDLWFGPQDAKSLVLSRAGLVTADLPALLPKVQGLAARAFSEVYGERTPNPALTRVLHLSASKALKGIDAKGRYTCGRASLHFDPSRTRVRIDRGNRSGRERSTVVLRLIATTPEAAAFLYAGGGYNLGKLERLLEGVLIGCGNYQSAWLGSLRVPERLRIDVDLPEDIGERLGARLSSMKEVESLPLDSAVEVGLLQKTSSIHNILAGGSTTKDLNIILYRESETIGPSIQFAWIVGALSTEIVSARGQDITALDLFSGSGRCTRNNRASPGREHLLRRHGDKSP